MNILISEFIEAILDCKYKTSDNENVKLGNFVGITTDAKFPQIR